MGDELGAWIGSADDAVGGAAGAASLGQIGQAGFVAGVVILAVECFPRGERQFRLLALETAPGRSGCPARTGIALTQVGQDFTGRDLFAGEPVEFRGGQLRLPVRDRCGGGGDCGARVVQAGAVAAGDAGESLVDEDPLA
ncbi:hypothetical protein ACWCPQ_29375 [Nocardia sp. NPDC001965]